MKRTLAARIVDSRTEYQGFLSVRRYEIEETLHGGGQQRVVRLIMERGHSVAVLPYDPVRDRVVLISELRPGILVAGGPAFSDSLVAGVVEPGEHVLAAAAREAREEAGLTLRSPRVIHQQAFVSPGGTSESIAIVYGIVDAPESSEIHGNASEAENIRTVILSPRKLMNRVRSGVILDMKTLLAGYWLAANRAKLRREILAPRLDQVS
ncbi:MAG TPA: NUDIX domain-containing protein [Steroidobacteraceae bacterium]|nr:NUDIX domain-containing protein [Steroidobacteraceae bacterium]